MPANLDRDAGFTLMEVLLLVNNTLLTAGVCAVSIWLWSLGEIGVVDPQPLTIGQDELLVRGLVIPAEAAWTLQAQAPYEFERTERHADDRAPPRRFDWSAAGRARRMGGGMFGF